MWQLPSPKMCNGNCFILTCVAALCFSAFVEDSCHEQTPADVQKLQSLSKAKAASASLLHNIHTVHMSSFGD